MFSNAKTLIIVYKNEMILNQLKKLIETKNDTDDGIIGVKDNSVNVVAWSEKVWLANKKPGNIQGKILFIGDIKGTKELIPVIDIKFDNYGVKYGWAGNQAVLYVDNHVLNDRNRYLSFISCLKELPIPEIYKQPKNVNINESKKFDSKTIRIDNHMKSKNKNKFSEMMEKAKIVVEKSTNTIEKNSIHLAMKAEDILRDKKFVTTQMLFYGVVNLYNNDLENFMNA